MSTPQKKRLSRTAWIAIACAAAAVIVMTVICILGFREGGWFRGQDTPGGSVTDADGTRPSAPETGGGSGMDPQTLRSLTDYAKQLEANGNTEAAAAVYELIAACGDGSLIAKAHGEIPAVKGSDALEQFIRFRSGDGRKGGE